jgi:hypothetical protein
MPTTQQNEETIQGKWLLRREVSGNVIVVKAVAVPRSATWGVTVTLNGEVIEHRHIEDFLREAEALIEAAILEIEVVPANAPVIETVVPDNVVCFTSKRQPA